MTARRGIVISLFVALCAAPAGADGPSLTVRRLVLQPDETGVLLVQGRIDGESAFGVTITAEILPRPGARGAVSFTPAPPTDITQEGDPWDGAGSFTPFDTDVAGSTTLNGAVMDNGTFVAEPTSFDGELVGFPVVASTDAAGVWDVTLTFDDTPSTWDNVATKLTDGTIEVEGVVPGIPTVSGVGLMALAVLLALGGIVLHGRRQGSRAA